MKIAKLAALVGATLGSIAGSSAAAQCRPPASSHEARLLAFYEVPSAFSPSGAPKQLPAGAVELGAEALPVPSPNSALAHPDYCYQYTTNNTKLAPVFGRPRLLIGLPWAFTAEASYLPPIDVADARATVGSVALSRVQALSMLDPRLSFLLRVHATAGDIGGPITCPRASLQTTDAGAPCYGTAPSHDHFDPRSLGVEAALGVTAGRVALYAGGGSTWERPHFQAGFTDGAGNRDQTTVDVALVRATAFGGASIYLKDRLELSAQLYAIPRDVTTSRIAFSYRIW